MKVLHWTIQAYDSTNEKNHLINVTEIQVNHAIDEGHALDQAKKIIRRPLYRLKSVWECHDCAKEEKIKKEMLKFLEKHNKEDEE